MLGDARITASLPLEPAPATAGSYNEDMGCGHDKSGERWKGHFTHHSTHGHKTEYVYSACRACYATPRLAVEALAQIAHKIAYVAQQGRTYDPVTDSWE
jgi:hypothetical protein